VARLQALNPALCASDVAKARRQMEDAAFRRDRMQEAVRRLGERLREVKAKEEQARRRAAYDAALAERDKLAAELAEVYPPLAAKLADLAARIAGSDAAIERINRELPNGSKRVDNAELVARQLSNFVDGPSNIPRITWHMRLPAFRYAPLEPYSWPPA
jgi:chromosome segregation ATPase